MLASKLKAILAARGKSADFTRDVRVQDDGAGAYLAYWDEEKLGPRPTQEEIDATDATKITHNADIDRQIAALEAQITTRMLIDAAAGTPFAGYLKIIEQIKALRAERMR